MPSVSPAPGPGGRPRAVVAAFYCWVVGGVLIAAVGLLMLTQSMTLLKVMGLMLIVDGIALGFFAAKARRGDGRFGRVAVALAMASVAVMALVVLFLTPALGVVAIIGLAVLALIAGSVLNQRQAAQQWYFPEAAE